jgi:hypothetical protein
LSGWSGYVSSGLRTGFKSSIYGCYPRVASQCMGTVTERNARRRPEPARGARRCTHWPHSRRVALADANVIFSAPPGAPALRDVSQTATMPEEPPPRQTQIPATGTHHPRPHQPPPATLATPATTHAGHAGHRPPRTPAHQPPPRWPPCRPARRARPAPTSKPPGARRPAAAQHHLRGLLPPGRLPPQPTHHHPAACRPGDSPPWAPAALADTPPGRRQPRPRAGLCHATAPPLHRASSTHVEGDRPPESPTITDIACERYGLRPELSDSGAPSARYVVGNPSILISG